MKCESRRRESYDVQSTLTNKIKIILISLIFWYFFLAKRQKIANWQKNIIPKNRAENFKLSNSYMYYRINEYTKLYLLVFLLWIHILTNAVHWMRCGGVAIHARNPDKQIQKLIWEKKPSVINRDSTVQTSVRFFWLESAPFSTPIWRQKGSTCWSEKPWQYSLFAWDTAFKTTLAYPSTWVTRVCLT